MNQFRIYYDTNLDLYCLMVDHNNSIIYYSKYLNEIKQMANRYMTVEYDFSIIEPLSEDEQRRVKLRETRVAKLKEIFND